MKRVLLLIFFFFVSFLPFAAKAQVDYDSIKCAMKVDKLIRKAKSFLGTPYVWAANGPNAFDCSGFVHYIYAQVDVDIKRNSKQLSETGIGITPREARRGDLIFFYSSKKPDRDIAHVGIVITDYKDGNFQFIHANSGAGCVSISEYQEPRFKKNYGGLRRVMPCMMGN